jgi:hypothetical protein
MPERQDDNNGLWKYPTVYPGANLKLNPNAIRLEDGLVEAVGLDGRFLGALRPFPGMADTTVHGVPKPGAGMTITSITNIIFAKYVAIQKGQSGDFLKGIAYIADNPSGTGRAIYFAYRDSSSGATDVRMLEDFNSWTDFKLTSQQEYDLTSLGRYIYAALSGDTTSSIVSFQNKQPPYNKAYFWDFKVNTWDTFVTGFAGRFMSILTRRMLSTSVNEDILGLSSSAYDTEVYGPTGHITPDGEYTYAVQLISRKHRLRSYIRMRTLSALGTPNSGLRFFLNEIKRPVDYAVFIQQVLPNASTDGRVNNWGMPHLDGFRFYRTPNNDSGQPIGKYTPVGGLFKIDDYIELGADFSGSGLFQRRYDHDSIIGTIFNDGKTTYYEDGGLVQQEQYDPFLDDFGPAPRLKRLMSYDGLLVGITDVEEPTSFQTDDWQENERSPESIVWSTLIKDEPENFPVENMYRPDNASERFLALISCGDHLFAISNAAIYRATRSGGSLGINKMTSALGGVSRYGQAAVGSSLFVVTASGVKEIDANTGEVRSLSIMDRIILDDSEWAGSLANVFVEYDAKLGALVFLNTNKKQCYLLWEATGAVTKVEDCPWTFLASGPDVLTDGPQRVYFITNTATVHVIDGSRQMGKRSMCGTTLTETVNGTTTTASATNLIDTAATFPANCVGFRAYILSGLRSGESAEITVRNSATNLTITGLSGTLAVGDRYSVSPVLTRITLPQLVGQGGDIDPFVRKTTTAMTVAFSDLGGEYAGVNGKVVMGVKQNLTTLGSTEVAMDPVPDQVVGRVNLHSTRCFPFIEFKGGNLDFEVQSVLVKGILGISEFQSRAGT